MLSKIDAQTFTLAADEKRLFRAEFEGTTKYKSMILCRRVLASLHRSGAPGLQCKGCASLLLRIPNKLLV